MVGTEPLPHAADRVRVPRRFMAMMWRLNFLVAVTCVVLQNSYMLYYICPMHTLFTIMVYAALGTAPQYNQSHAGILIKCAWLPVCSMQAERGRQYGYLPFPCVTQP